MNEVATSVVIELAKEFIETMQKINPQWMKAYFRFRSKGSNYGCNGSYTDGSAVSLIDSLKYSGFCSSMNEKGTKLLKALGKSQGVFLLLIDAEFNYDIKFEWDDLRRWEITKLDGKTGLPEGL